MNDRGFTLLELLLSIVLLVMITGILGGALHMAHSSLQRGEKKILQLERMKVSYFLMEAQIQSLLPYRNEPDGPRIFFAGSRDTLRMLSGYSLWRSTRGNVVVSYDVLTGPSGKQRLQVTERLPFQEMADETTLFENCDRIEFSYFQKTGLAEGKWVDNWSGENAAIPAEIRLDLACRGRHLSYLFNAFAKPTEAAQSSAPGDEE
ncbi:MAG: prepilin-type N-terminal cleavage/methylation domain-containing protein [Deltaproteobacteria bacterium]